MDRTFTRLGASVADLAAAWPDRMKDAEALLRAGRHAWAIATALYALEIRLKVLVCKKLDVDELPRAFEIHDLGSLLLLAGLSRRIQRKAAARVKRNWDEVLEQAKNLGELRYTPDGNWTAAQAKAFLKRLTDATDGVLTWLARQR